MKKHLPFIRTIAFLCLALTAIAKAAECPDVHTPQGQYCLLHITTVDALVAQTQYQTVTQCLANHGVPSAVLTEGKMSGVDSVFFTYPAFPAMPPTTAMDVINSPYVFANDLHNHGVVPDLGYFTCDAPAPPPPPVRIEKPASTKCAVGKMEIGASGSVYYDNAGALPRSGDLCTDSRGTFKAFTSVNPFGTNAVWYMQAPPPPPPPPTVDAPSATGIESLSPDQLKQLLALAKMLGLIK
jgi:hypothetical protein